MNKIFKKNIFYISVSIILFVLIYHYFNITFKKNIEPMGNKNSSEKLNKSLVFISNLLNDNNIKNWFIGYGTLLGIIRDDSCIDGDDDIDIICDLKDYNKIKLLLENNLPSELKMVKKNFIKTQETNDLSSVDFYMANVDTLGNFNDTWEKVIWSDCYKNNKLIKKQWNSITLNIPNNYETKLINRYGENWRIKQNNKGPKPRKKIL